MRPAKSFQDALIDLNRFVEESGNKSEGLFGITFSPPGSAFAEKELFKPIDQYHRRSKGLIYFFFAGYRSYGDADSDGLIRMGSLGKSEWVFDPSAFDEFCEELAEKSDWRYSGGCDFLLAEFRFDEQNQPVVNFETMVCFSFDRLKHQGRLVNAATFFENLFRHFKNCHRQNNSWKIGLDEKLGSPLKALCIQCLSASPQTENPNVLDSISEVSKLPKPHSTPDNSVALCKGPFSYDKLSKQLRLPGRLSRDVPSQFARILDGMTTKNGQKPSARITRLDYYTIAALYEEETLKAKQPAYDDKEILGWMKNNQDRIRREAKTIAQGFRKEFGRWCRKYNIDVNALVRCNENEDVYELGGGWDEKKPVLNDSEAARRPEGTSPKGGIKMNGQRLYSGEDLSEQNQLPDDFPDAEGRQ